MGLAMEQRVVLALTDTIDFPTAFLGAIKAGIIPVAVNTLLTSRDYEYMLSDSRAKALVVSEQLLSQFAPLLPNLPFLKHVIVSGAGASGRETLEEVLAKGSPELAPAPTTCDDPCFWMYSSGSTGAPKAAVHVHSSMAVTADLYAKGVLGVTEKDVLFSAAKLAFAYGLGNAQTFALATGATAVLMAERATPAAVFKRLAETKPSIFYAVPTLYGAMLASPSFRKTSFSRCASAFRRARPCRPTWAGAGKNGPASTSWRASVRPRCCTCSSALGREMYATARPVSPCPVTSCAWWTSGGFP